MAEFQSTYRQILKSTSIFGGVQVFQIVIALINSKFVAVLLGPAGMGIASLINSGISLIQVLTNLGLGTSAVKNLSAANATGDNNRINEVSNIIKKLVWVSGLLGMIVTIVFARTLSRISFGNYDYTYAFIFVSVVLLFSQLAIGRNVILQSLRKLILLAKASLIGSVIGLLVSIPIYYIWGIKGIVPAIIISSFFSLVNSYYFSKKVKIPKLKIQTKVLLREGISMGKLGIVISLAQLMTLGSSYIIRIYISNQGGVGEVGLFAAGFALINTYVGMVLNAMSTDYFPRLSGVANNNKASTLMVNQQAEITTLILTPILTFFIVFINFVILILLSSKFITITGMVQWAALGMFFRALSWPMGYLMLTKGTPKIYFLNELISTSYILFLNMLGYHYWGLNGLGFSFIIGNLLTLIQVYVLVNFKFDFKLQPNVLGMFALQLFIGIVCIVAIKLLLQPYIYIIAIPLIILSIIYSYSNLNRVLNLKSILISVFNRIKH